ncbi:MAG: hypothetical protein ACT4QA_05455 [Panacagrimonas sp.]
MLQSESPTLASDTSTATVEKQRGMLQQKSTKGSTQQTEKAYFDVKVPPGRTLVEILGPLDQLGKG